MKRRFFNLPAPALALDLRTSVPSVAESSQTVVEVPANERPRTSGFRGAQAPRLLAIAPSRLRTFSTKSASARAPKLAGEAPALPKPQNRASSSPALLQ